MCSIKLLRWVTQWRVDDVLRNRGDLRCKPAIRRVAGRIWHRRRTVWNPARRFSTPIDAISKVSFGVFVPIYFGIIGYRLVFGWQFSFAILLVFLVGSSLISVFSAGLAAWLGGFRGLDVINIAITTNARGGPGIVLASVAYDAGIINAAFYTTLVIIAVVTSQMAGAWLRFVLSKGWPLLSTNPDETWKLGEAESGPVLPHGTEGVPA
jgi:hypothetical protein